MEIQENIPLNNKTWFETGGAAKYFAEPVLIDDYKSALDFAKQKNCEVFLLGCGANILMSDDGFNGLVIKPANKSCEIIFAEKDKNNVLARAGAGTKIDDFISFCLSSNLTGFEEFSGIPGTIGGAVFINIHYFEFLLSDFLISARVINKSTGEIVEVSRDWFDFGYDKSKLHDGNWILFDAVFKLKKVDEIETAIARGRSIEIIRHRENRYPTERTCGSFFQNFSPEEINFEINGKKQIHIAYYLDKLGIKGELSVGGAHVSRKHANMIENDGTATSTDILNLAKKMRELVKEKYGIVPKLECQLIGF
ncbi:MAG: UDP-N-acetylenolpyruvoylglucosamine reductase [Chlamydiae bacterium]|nr:MAG: UDP-N-acetylenolpyruvoylglucosamine reductase [Chlamydiota bacterium]